MKKLLLMAAVAGFALASCTSEDETYEAQNNQKTEISFAAPVMYKATRAAGEVTGTTYPKTEEFSVFGIKYAGTYAGWDKAGVDGAFTANTQNGLTAALPVSPKSINGNVIGWFPAKKETFEDNMNYAFAAYSPTSMTTPLTGPVDGVEASGDAAATGLAYGANGLTLNFAVQDLPYQEDFMYSNRNYDVNKDYVMGHTGNEGNQDYDGVNLIFKHALSSIHFKTCVDPAYLRAVQAAGYDETTFTIKSITLEGVKNTGSFNENISSADDGNKTYVSNPVWSKQAGKQTYNFFTSSIEEAGTKVPRPADINSTLEAELKDISDKTVFTNDKGYSGILLPQNFAENNDAVIKIVWRMSSEAVDKTTTIPLNIWTTEWLPAKRYIYNIIFKENLIYFAPQVEDWTEGGSANITPTPNPAP